jgi:hypothetical protein
MSKKILTEKDHLENKARLAEIVTDEKTIVKVGDNEYEIGALTYYAKWQISSRITKLELADAQLSTLIQSMAVNLPLLAEILGIAILRDRQKIETGLDGLKWDIMDCANTLDWHNLLITIIKKLDTGFFFTLTELVRGINSMNDKAGYRQMMEKNQEGDGYVPIQNLARSAE